MPSRATGPLANYAIDPAIQSLGSPQFGNQGAKHVQKSKGALVLRFVKSSLAQFTLHAQKLILLLQL